MGYLRANGRIEGRVSGRWGRASVRGGYSLGDEVDIGQTGIAPTIQGDATTALIAQVNRFQKAAGGPQFPLATGQPIPIGPAAAAMRILFERYTVATIKTPDDGTIAKLEEVSKAQSDPVRYITPRLDQVTREIALYGDSKGLPPSPIGITTVSMFKRMSTTQKAVILGVAAVAAAVLLGRK